MRKKEYYRQKSRKLKGLEMGRGLASLRQEMKVSVPGVRWPRLDHGKT